MSRKWVWKGAEYVLNEKAVNKIFGDTTERRQATGFNEVRWIIRPCANRTTLSKKKQ